MQTQGHTVQKKGQYNGISFIHWQEDLHNGHSSHKTEIFTVFSNLSSTLLLLALHIIIEMFPEKFKSYNNKRKKNTHINWNSCFLALEKENMNKGTTKCILLLDPLIFYNQLL